MLNLEVPFLQRLSDAAIDDVFLLAELSPRPGDTSLPVEYLSLTHRSLEWGAGDSRHLYALSDGDFDTKRDTLESEPPESTITFSNLSEEWYKRLNQQGLEYNGALLTLRLVFASVDPSDEDESERSQIADGPWVLSGARVDDTAATFSFGAAFNALKLEVPVLNSRSRRCQFIYKGAFCKSTSTLFTCAKTLSDCAARHPEVRRFSAWPYSNQRSF